MIKLTIKINKNLLADEFCDRLVLKSRGKVLLLATAI